MVDYSKAIIYRLVCKDPTITDEYIGSTVCKYRRKSHHKTCCNNENREQYNLPVYQCIRANGGFENWSMIMIEEYRCNNKNELHMRERHWIEERRPTLNMVIRPVVTEEECKEQRKQYRKKHKEEIREQRKQYREENKEKIKEKKSKTFLCECGSEYTDSHKSRHMKTQKHLKYLEELNDLKEDN